MKIDSTTLLLIGAAAVGVYLLTRPTTPTPVYSSAVYNPYATTNPALAQNYAGNTTAQDIAAGSSALTALGNALGNFF
jgi:hypothetical protein